MPIDLLFFHDLMKRCLKMMRAVDIYSAIGGARVFQAVDLVVTNGRQRVGVHLRSIAVDAAAQLERWDEMGRIL